MCKLQQSICHLYIPSCPVLELTSVPRRWWYNSQERYVDCVTECLWSCMVLWHSMLVLGHLLMVTVPVHYNCQSCTGLPCHIVVLALHQVFSKSKNLQQKTYSSIHEVSYFPFEAEKLSCLLNHDFNISSSLSILTVFKLLCYPLASLPRTFLSLMWQGY